LLTVTAAAVLTTLIVGARLRRPPVYFATATFRMAEGDLHDPNNVPRPSPAIREWISDVALNRERLLTLMKKHAMLSALRERDPAAAVSSLREDISVWVIRNYFLLDRPGAGEPRTAEIMVSYRDLDREFARALVHDIANTIVENQAAARRTRVAAAQRVAEREAQRARERLRSLEEKRAAAIERADGRDRLPSSVLQEIALSQREVELALARVAEIRRRAADLTFASAAESRRLWLDIKLVDESIYTLRKPLDAGALVLFASTVFATLLVVCAATVGAFDRRVYEAADVVAAGLPLLGAVPRTGSEGPGSYHWRRRRASRPHHEAEP
jgi:hypothetical protein